MSLLNTEDDGYSGESRRKHLILAALWIALIGIGALVTVYAIAPLVLKTPAVVKRTVLDVDLKDAELAVLTNIDFGYCVPGEVSGDVYINVVNSGNVPVMISSINITDPVQPGASALTLFSNGADTAIVAGGTREIMLWVYMPLTYTLDTSNFQVTLTVGAA